MKYLVLTMLLMSCATTPEDCVELHPPVTENCPAPEVFITHLKTCWTRTLQAALSDAHNVCIRTVRSEHGCAGAAIFHIGVRGTARCYKSSKAPKIQWNFFFRDRDAI